MTDTHTAEHAAEMEAGIVIRPERARSVFIPVTVVAIMLSLTASGSWTAALWFRSMTERLRAIEVAVAEMPKTYITHAQMARASEYFAYKNPALIVPDFNSLKQGGRIVPINDRP